MLTVTDSPRTAWRNAFVAAPGHLDAATCGLPTRATAQSLHSALDAWQAGEADLAAYDAAVARSRGAFAQVVGVPPEWVAVGSQTSVLVGGVAASLPDGARVLLADGDFSSVTYPFLAQADRGVRVRSVPLHALADELRPGTDLVAFSAVQSSDGRIADLVAIADAARATGTRTLVDLTQSAGWLPVDASGFDITVTAAYKWLCSPRGVAFATVHPRALAALRPVHAGWYAGLDPWASCYGTTMRLADDARRLDVSPAWLAWVGAAPALDLAAGLDAAQVRDHDVALADSLLAGLDLPAGGSAIVALDDPSGTRRAALTAAGLRVSGRAGRVRLAFHLWNDESSVAAALTALRP